MTLYRDLLLDIQSLDTYRMCMCVINLSVRVSYSMRTHVVETSLVKIIYLNYSTGTKLY